MHGTKSMAAAGDVILVSPRAEQPAAKKRRVAGQRHQPQAATTRTSLPLDLVVEIAARSDAATLMRCAATCRDARRIMTDDPANLSARLRLRDTGRFPLPLLHGHLGGTITYDGYGVKKAGVSLVDTTTADAAAIHLVDETTLRDAVPLDSRNGLVLVRATARAHPLHRQLVVSSPAARRSLALPPEPEFLEPHPSLGADVRYVLLVSGEGGAAIGRPFQVIMAALVLSKRCRCDRRLLVHTFSSEEGAWSPLMEIPTHNLQGSTDGPSLLHHRALVIGNVVHWLCLTDSKSYMLSLDVRATRVVETALPASFPRDAENDDYHTYLLATASAAGTVKEMLPLGVDTQSLDGPDLK